MKLSISLLIAAAVLPGANAHAFRRRAQDEEVAGPGGPDEDSVDEVVITIDDDNVDSVTITTDDGAEIEITIDDDGAPAEPAIDDDVLDIEEPAAFEPGHVCDDVLLSRKASSIGDNPCEGSFAALGIGNTPCFDEDGNAVAGEQAAGEVTEGYNGNYESDYEPLTTPYYQSAMCPVNVHWHLGAEHLSSGEYDDNGTGPEETNSDVQMGRSCSLYDESDEKFTKEYNWQYCTKMTVGQTYEVHWPHSAAGACGTQWQFQTHFSDGVFCNAGMLDLTDLPSQIGVQGQVFVVVNDEDYYYPNMMNGWIYDSHMEADIAYYTGSTTGASVNNEECSGASPITWQVDRKCHMISASSFDKLCADMLTMNDDMSGDVHPHGSRVLVDDDLAANNQQI